MNKRENGFYWVTFNSYPDVKTRVIAEYLNGDWFVTGCQFDSADDIEEISATRIAE